MLKRIGLASGIALLLSPAAFAATDFVDTTLRPNTTGGLVVNNGGAGNWSLEGPKIGDGNSNRLGGAADPQVGNDDAAHGSVPLFSMGNGTNGGYIDYNYLASPGSGLSGSAYASIDSVFRARNINNGGGQSNAP